MKSIQRKVIRTFETVKALPKEFDFTPPNVNAKLINVKFGWMEISSAEERAGNNHYYVEAYWEVEIDLK